MPNYDFKTLSPIDFEILVRDLLQKELKISLESFKSGQDQGIDLRFCPSADKSLIIQCKHYASSTFSMLLNNLGKSELPKVKKLNPSRYSIATSLSLSPLQKDKILTVLKPFILKTGDIFGRDELNGLLATFPDVEKSTFKLWFSSVPIFEEILHSKVINVSKDALEKIQRNAKFYVYNRSFPEALKILAKHNFCIIAGIPGIGKTTLAEMLLLHYLEQDYKVVKVAGDISEVTGLDYHNCKRVIYYDDFLGQTSLSEKFNKNEDQKLLDFIATVHNSRISKLILTTREYILNQTKMVYEKIAREKFDPEICIIDLSKYTRRNRAEILFNHIYFSNLPDEYKNMFLENKNYLKIIDHKNYNPRIVDFMTQFTRVESVSPSNYMTFFMSNLENPLEIWKHAFEQQLSRQSRHLLLVMASLPEKLFLYHLHQAFDAFHKKQASHYKFERTPNDFKNSLKELEGNFISTEKSKDQTVVQFHNPSIRDFLKKYISTNPHELLAIVESATFHEQIMLLWEHRENKFKDFKYRQLLIAHPDVILTALNRTLNSVTCRLINTAESDGRIYKSIWHILFEARVILIATVAKEIGSEKFMHYFEQCMDLVENRIEKKQADCEDLVRLLKELKRMKLINATTHQNLIQKTKKYCMDELDHLSAFEPFIEFKKVFSEFVNVSDIEELKVKFEKIACEDLDYSSENPDYYRDDACKIESLAKHFNLDMSKRVRELEEMAEDIENEIPYDEDSNGGRSSYKDSDDNCSDVDIESIFNSLKC